MEKIKAVYAFFASLHSQALLRGLPAPMKQTWHIPGLETIQDASRCAENTSQDHYQAVLLSPLKDHGNLGRWWLVKHKCHIHILKGEQGGYKMEQQPDHTAQDDHGEKSFRNPLPSTWCMWKDKKSLNGSRKDKVCLTNLISFNNDMSVLMDEEKAVYFLDYSMTSNTTSQSIFISKPCSHGITRQVEKLLES